MRYRPLLQAHGITVDVVPFFLGAAREAAGNPFAPTPKWRQAFATQDCAMTAEMLGLNLSTPEEFPILSLFVSFSAHAIASLLTEDRLFVSRRG